MISGLDHVVVLVRDVGIAIDAYRLLLGREVSWRAIGDGVETAIFTLANTSVELMAAHGEGVAAQHVRQTLDASGEGLASLVFRVSDIERMHRRLSRLALTPDEIREAGSIDAASGARLSWRRTRAATAATHGVRLFFLEPAGERPVSEPAGDSPVEGLDHVVVNTPAPERAAALYGARLGLDMALDRTNPDWGARLMFFRCGDLIVEVVHRLGEAGGGGPDRFWGLCWRVGDAAAARARLADAGLDVSEVRAGRKPGTQVFTVKSGTCGVPTLMVQPSRPLA